METLYFSWELSAAVITGNEDNRTGFILPVLKEAGGWREATPDQVKDFSLMVQEYLNLSLKTCSVSLVIIFQTYQLLYNQPKISTD
jgi:hypothetical protein